MGIAGFKVRELERKMREAAAATNYEQAAILRDQLRAAQAELPVVPERPKVVGLWTREEFVATEGEGEGVMSEGAKPYQPGENLEEEVSLLKHILEEVEGGRLSGLVIVVGHLEEDGDISVTSAFSTSPASDNVQLFVGGMEECKSDLLAISDDMFVGEDEQ